MSDKLNIKAKFIKFQKKTGKEFYDLGIVKDSFGRSKVFTYHKRKKR